MLSKRDFDAAQAAYDNATPDDDERDNEDGDDEMGCDNCRYYRPGSTRNKCTAEECPI